MIAQSMQNEKSHHTVPLMSRRPELYVPSIVLDRTPGMPLHRQIHRQIAEAIRSGAVRHYARLPSTRFMAKLLRVSRNTVFAAYEELAADDLIRGEPGSCMRVNCPAAGATNAPAWLGLKQVIQAARYPARILAFDDPDGNALYLRF